MATFTQTDIFEHLLSKTHLIVSFRKQDKQGLLLLVYSNSSVFGVHTCVFVFCQLRFCQLIHLAPFWGWINVNAKPKKCERGLCCVDKCFEIVLISISVYTCSRTAGTAVFISEIDLLAILQKCLDRAIFLYNARFDGVALELPSQLCTFENSTKCSKVCIVRLRFFFRIAKRSIVVLLLTTFLNFS